MLGNRAANQISRNISKIKPKTRGNSAPITAPNTAPAALTAAMPLKSSSGNASNRKKYAIGVIILNRKAPNSADKVRLIIFLHSRVNHGCARDGIFLQCFSDFSLTIADFNPSKQLVGSGRNLS